MTSIPSIRALNRSDLPRVAQVEGLSLSDAWSEEQLAAELSRPGGRLLGAESGRGIVGYVCALWVSGELEILRIAVLPDYRRQGLASALLAALEDEYARKGLFRILLEVRADNRAAIQFYQRLAFVECGRRRGYYRDGTDAVLMERICPEAIG